MANEIEAVSTHIPISDYIDLESKFNKSSLKKSKHQASKSSILVGVSTANES